MAGEEKKEAKIDMEAVMEIYRKLATPGAPHKMLEGMEGSWTTRTLFWMEPGKPPVESTGTCEQRMILGGRFLKQEYEGNMMGSAFTGINIIGYDNHTGKYMSVWLDSMGTGIFYFEGSGGEDGKTITQESRYDDPIRGPSVWRSVTTVVDRGTIVYEGYLTDKSGKEEKLMEMTLTRK